MVRTRRVRYQAGNVERRSRANGPDVWLFRYREYLPDGRTARRGLIIGTTKQYATESQALRAAEEYRGMANRQPSFIPVSFGQIVEQYLADELPGRTSTRTFYRPWFRNHIIPKWGTCALAEVKPLEIQRWLNSLSLKKKSKQHIRSLMKMVFAYAMTSGLMEVERNPLELVRVTAGENEMVTEKRVLTPAEFRAIVTLIPEPYKTMCFIACCLGLRVSEILGLQYGDIDWDKLEMYVQRAVVLGVVGRVKTKQSKGRMPLDPDLAELLLDYKLRTNPNASATDWLFVNPDTGRPWRPSHIQTKYIRPAGEKVCGEGIGWHNFRHTFSTMLRANGTDIKVQQELLRHADVRTTLNIYTQAAPDQKRDAASRIAKMVLPGVNGHFLDTR